MNKITYFDRFALEFPAEAITDCSHSGSCDEDVAYWSKRIVRPTICTPENLRAELKSVGAWDAVELTDDAANWERIVWVAAGNLKQEANDAERLA